MEDLQLRNDDADNIFDEAEDGDNTAGYEDPMEDLNERENVEEEAEAEAEKEPHATWESTISACLSNLKGWRLQALRSYHQIRRFQILLTSQILSPL